MITLKQLEALYWIAHLGTFQRAAQKLNTTQSTVSKRIGELEQATRVPLFDRSQRNAKLTCKGEQLLALAEDMLALQQQAEALADSDAVPDRVLRLGLTELTALTWLPRFIRRLQDDHPHLRIETEVGLGRQLHDRLCEDRLDLAILPATFLDPQLESVHLADVKNVWMGSPQVVDPERRYAIYDLANYTILLQGPKSGSGVWVNRWLQSEAAHVPNQIVADSLVAVLGLAVAGLGVTYLPEHCFASLLSEGKLAILRTNPDLPDLPYVACYRKDRPGSFFAQIAETAKQCCDFTTQLQI